MMHKKKITPANIGIALGASFILLALLLVTVTQIRQTTSIEKAKKCTDALIAAMPERYDAVPDDRINMTMPAMQIRGDSFCGILEVPNYSVALPIRESWKKSKLIDYPCRYTGSIYNGSLIIGGSDHKGQLDFITRISNGDLVVVTDMTGARYSYQVTDIRKTKDVSTENLTSMDVDLVLFARNSYGLDYTVVRCMLNSSI